MHFCIYLIRVQKQLLICIKVFDRLAKCLNSCKTSKTAPELRSKHLNTRLYDKVNTTQYDCNRKCSDCNHDKKVFLQCKGKRSSAAITACVFRLRNMAVNCQSLTCAYTTNGKKDDF